MDSAGFPVMDALLKLTGRGEDGHEVGARQQPFSAIVVTRPDQPEPFDLVELASQSEPVMPTLLQLAGRSDLKLRLEVDLLERTREPSTMVNQRHAWADDHIGPAINMGARAVPLLSLRSFAIRFSLATL